MTANGRRARYYIAGERGDPNRFYMPVTYHRKGRQLTVSPKLLRKVLREPAR